MFNNRTGLITSAEHENNDNTLSGGIIERVRCDPISRFQGKTWCSLSIHSQYRERKFLRAAQCLVTKNSASANGIKRILLITMLFKKTSVLSPTVVTVLGQASCLAHQKNESLEITVNFGAPTLDTYSLYNTPWNLSESLMTSYSRV